MVKTARDMQVGDVVMLSNPLFSEDWGAPYVKSLIVVSATPRWWYRLTKKEDPKPFVVRTGLGYSLGFRYRAPMEEVDATLRLPNVSVHRPQPDGSLQQIYPAREVGNAG